MEAAGLISRREQPGSTAHTDYCLTQDGRTLEPVMAAMAGWGRARSEEEGQGPV